MKKFFTLVELLVVIAIISVLASMLLPALQRARASAMAVTCLSSLGQVGKAQLFYADEHDNFMFCRSSTGWNGTWPQILERKLKYLGSRDAMSCPANNAASAIRLANPVADPDTADSAVWSAYGVWDPTYYRDTLWSGKRDRIGWFVTYDSGWTWVLFKMNAVRNPSDTALFCDATRNTADAAPGAPYSYFVTSGALANAGPQLAHLQRLSTGYPDGHVASLAMTGANKSLLNYRYFVDEKAVGLTVLSE